MSKDKKFELAPQDEVDKCLSFAEQFLLEIFDVDGVLLTDESSLYDFDFEFPEDGNFTVKHRTEEYLKKIEYIYGVDVSDVEGLKIYKVVNKILEAQGVKSD